MAIPKKKLKAGMSPSAWLKAIDKNQLWFANQLGISNAQANRIVRGLAMPRAPLALRIQSLSGGVVTVEAMARARTRNTDNNRTARIKHGQSLMARGAAIVQAATK